jgi:hypothetical protein
MDDTRADALTNALLVLATAIERVADRLADRAEEVSAQPAFRIEEYPRAYDYWSPEDDATLREAYENGQDVESLAVAFGRSEGAIRARLTRLMVPAQDG